MRHVLAAFALLVLTAPALRAENAVTAKQLTVEPPTLICLGFEWDLAGDDNRNSSVEVGFRKAGETRWRDALPLLRIGGERIYRNDLGLDYTVPDGFAGSIFDLEPATEYEVRFTMRDPDGVSGDAIRTVKARTRGEPAAASGGRVLHVYPPAWKGENLGWKVSTVFAPPDARSRRVTRVPSREVR